MSFNKSEYKDIEPFNNRIWLASPTMHGDELKWINDAFEMIEA